MDYHHPGRSGTNERVDKAERGRGLVSETVLITDSCCDLPPDMLDAAGIDVLFFPYTLDGEEHLDDFGRTIPLEDFYTALDGGATAHTSQVPLAEYFEAFERAYESGRSVLLISLSSGLSGTHDTSVLARERFLEGHPEADIYCVDSLCASGGEGLLVLEASERLGRGATAREVAEWVEENRTRVHAVFTVDSFEHLVRGGRVPPAAGMVGTMLNIKPILHVDVEGRLVPLKTPRGRRRAIEMLAAMVVSGVGDGDRRVIVSHGDCADDAAALVAKIREAGHVTDILTTRTGVIVGTHTGRGVLSAYYLGTPRTSAE
jgi:DegV family protein with EDD domain